MLAGIALYSCEGPMGPAGKDGADGADANETCKECHNATSVDLISVQYQFSKHEYGEAAFEEAGSTSCGPCHLQEAFKDVVARNVPSTFTQATPTSNYVNSYACSSTTAYGEIGCSTCHSKLHSEYGLADLAFTTTSAVPMTMYGGTKTINLTQKSGMSNLCVKCHQPRPMTINNAVWTNGGATNPTGNPIDYASLAVKANYADPVWTGTSASAGYGFYKPTYRSHVHYGVVGAAFAGIGGIEFPESEAYVSSTHTATASCQDCHMATMNGKSGEHTFFAKGNFNGCNVTGCHTSASATSASLWTGPRANIKALLDQLAGLLKVTNNGVEYELLNRNADAEANLWAGLTTNKYDGYLNIINSSNPNTGPTVIPNTFFTLTKVQLGAIINFQYALREYSLGIHNYKYVHALLHNSIEALGAVPVN